MNDFELATKGQWFEIFKRYEKYLYKYLLKQGVDRDDLNSEAWFLLDGAKNNFDVSKVTEPEKWFAKYLLDYQLNKSWKARKTNKKVETVCIDTTEHTLHSRPEKTYASIAGVEQKLTFTKILDKVTAQYSERHREVLLQLVAGHRAIDVAANLGISKQRVSYITKELQPLVQRYL